MDHNLEHMSPRELIAEVQNLRDGIRHFIRHMDNRDQLRWTLVGVAAFTVPLPVTDFLVMAGIAPLLGIAMLFFFDPLVCPFLLGYSAAFYYISGSIARFLMDLPLKARRYTLAAVVVGLLILGFFPLHWVGSHRTPEPVTAYEFYSKGGHGLFDDYGPVRYKR